MCDCPGSLQELCLDAVCDNISEVFELYYESLEDCGLTNEDNKSSDNYSRNFSVVHRKFRLRDPDIFLFNEISERLLAKLSERNLLSDSTLNLFSAKNTRLKAVRIVNTRKVTAEGLKVLKHHKLTDLECINLRNISIGKILGP